MDRLAGVPAGHELLLRLAGRFPDELLWRLRDWLARFDESLPRIREMGFDEGFIRVWRFYLAACAASFSVGRTDVIQYRMSHG